jgi:hypothetical protein
MNLQVIKAAPEIERTLKGQPSAVMISGFAIIKAVVEKLYESVGGVQLDNGGGLIITNDD